jgi:hypothetical protein
MLPNRSVLPKNAWNVVKFLPTVRILIFMGNLFSTMYVTGSSCEGKVRLRKKNSRKYKYLRFFPTSFLVSYFSVQTYFGTFQRGKHG